MTKPIRERAYQRVRHLLASQLVSTTTTVDFVLAAPRLSSEDPCWHYESCAHRSAEILQRRTETLASLAALLDPDADTDTSDDLLNRRWCGCAGRKLDLQQTWSPYELNAYIRWANVRVQLDAPRSDPRRLGATLVNLEMLAAMYDEEELTGDVFASAIPALHEQICVEGWSRLWDLAKEEDRLVAAKAASYQQRQAQQAAERAAAEASGLPYVPQPWRAMVELLDELVDAGVPAPVAVRSMREVVSVAALSDGQPVRYVVAEALRAAVSGSPCFGRAHGDRPHGPTGGDGCPERERPLSEGAQAFIDTVTALVAEGSLLH